MDLGFWTILILVSFLPSLIALILCLALIKKKPYKKLGKKQIYAGFWQRFIAGFIDLIILIIIEIVLILIPVIGWIASFFVTWLYFAIQHSSSKQATLGMRALDIQITNEKHEKISFWRATGNFYVTFFSSLIFFIGFFMIAFTSRKQGLHNLISRTIYIKVK
tara:strand:- start:7 stop:495 length:489 start_codon:yes stop_codon:yes gene_type:complete